MSLGDESITWCESIKYLGVHFLAGPSIKVDTDIIKRNFFASCNVILGNSVCQSELARLSLLESYCLPVLQYCTSAVYLNVTQLSELNACWNMVFRKIFGFHKWESVKLFIAGLGRLDLIHIRVWSCLKFCKRMISSTNQVIKTCCDVHLLGLEFNHLCCTFGVEVNLPYNVIRQNIFSRFNALAGL